MNGNSYLVDTNILLYLLSGDKTLINVLTEKKVYISFITELELLSHKNLTSKEKITIESLLTDCIIIDINQQIKNYTISTRSAYSIKLPDSIIAATARFLNIPLLTSDTDFKDIKELTTILYTH